MFSDDHSGRSLRDAQLTPQVPHSTSPGLVFENVSGTLNSAVSFLMYIFAHSIATARSNVLYP